MQKLNKLTRGIVVLSLLAFVGVVGCSDSDSGSTDPGSPTTITIDPASNLASGELTYGDPAGCTSCHLSDGSGTGGVNDLMVGAAMPPAEYSDFNDLKTYIEDFMPNGNPGLCVEDCARDVAAYVLCEYNNGMIPGGNDIAEGCPVP